MKPLLNALLLILVFCTCTESFRLETALLQSGANRPELEKVLSHYRDEPMKYRAACFLIEHMPGKYSLEAESVDDPYRNFLRHIPAKDSINWKLDSCHVGHLLDSVAQLAIPRVRKVEDLQTVTADFLIDNIDRAFHAWETSKYTRHYTFDDFLHHVLPYRIGHEPLTPWRGKAYERYAHLLDSAFTPLQVAVDMAMNEGMRYNIGMTKYPYLQSYEEMVTSRWGACEEMAAYLALSLRAVGIPADIDFVTTWANRSSGHCWNILKDTTGKFVEVGYDPNGENRVIYKPSKIYRKDYASMGGADVTSEYAMPQSDLSFSLASEHEGRVAALCTFNNRDWVPVALAKCEKGNVLFPSVGRGALWGTNELMPHLDAGNGIVYLVQVQHEDGWLPVSAPLLLDEDGNLRELTPDAERKERLALGRKYPYYGEDFSRPYDSNNVRAGDLYELRYWQDGWRSLGKMTAESDTLVYEDVPVGALLWLHNHSGGREERIFTYENGKQVWW